MKDNYVVRVADEYRVDYLEVDGWLFEYFQDFPERRPKEN